MAHTKNKKRNIWLDLVAVVVIAAWAYFADFIIKGAVMREIDYPLVGSTIAGVVSVSKIWIFLVGVMFYLLASTLALSRFIGGLGAIIVMTEIMVVEPIQKLKELVSEIKGLGIESMDPKAAYEMYGTYPWKTDQTWIKLLMYIGAGLMAFLLVYFIVIVIKDRNAKNTTRKAVRNALIFIVILAVFIFIPGLIMQTGPQWLFISLMTLLAFITYMYGVIKRSTKETPVAAAAVTIVLMVVLMFMDMIYRIGTVGMAL